MKTPSLVAVVLCVALAGCATNHSLSSVGGKVEPGNREMMGYPISSESSLVMMAPFTSWPELSGYHLPAGTYKAESEDTNGVFFKAPDGFKVESPTGDTETTGGIYLPKQSSVGVRGHVYLWMPVFGGDWESYYLPDRFFARYGQTWMILQSNGVPATVRTIDTVTAPHL